MDLQQKTAVLDWKKKIFKKNLFSEFCICFSKNYIQYEAPEERDALVNTIIVLTYLFLNLFWSAIGTNLVFSIQPCFFLSWYCNAARFQMDKDPRA